MVWSTKFSTALTDSDMKTASGVLYFKSWENLSVKDSGTYIRSIIGLYTGRPEISFPEINVNEGQIKGSTASILNKTMFMQSSLDMYEETEREKGVFLIVDHSSPWYSFSLLIC